MSFAPNWNVLIAAVAGWIAGAIWYGIFGKAWLKALGRTKEEITAKQRAPGFYIPFVIAFAANLVMAWVLCGLMQHIGPLSARSGLISGGFVWLGFVVTTIATNYAFGGRRLMLTVIDAGHWLVVLLVIGAIIGGLGN